MRILIVASAYSKAEAFASVCKSFERLGHTVTYYPVHTKAIEMGRPLIGALDDKRDQEAKLAGVAPMRDEILCLATKADLVIFWKAELLYNQEGANLVHAISKMTKTLWWSWDDPYDVEVNPAAIKIGSLCRVAATCCANTAQLYRSPKKLWVPPGYDPEVHYEDGAPVTDVCFIATNTYCKEIYGKGPNPPFDRRDLVRAALEVTPNVELWGRGDEVLGWLHPVHGDPKFKDIYKGFIKFEEARKAISRAKVVVNSHVRRTGYKYFNERTFQIMGCKRPQLIDNNPGTFDYLSRPCFGVISYNNIPEFRALLYMLLNEGQSVCEARNDSALRHAADYTWDKWAQKILEAVQ